MGSNVLLVLDLDDTLYPEIAFVESGFRAVASHLQKHSGISKSESTSFMAEDFRQFGRGKVFDRLKASFSIPEVTVREMVSIYRSHLPEICLFPEALNLLRDLPSIISKKPYLVTDGNPRVQRSKIQALKLSQFFERTYCSRDFGMAAEKPSTQVFEHIAKREGVDFAAITYVGDDPSKDFHGVMAAGGRAIRVRTGRFASVELEDIVAPEIDLPSLAHLSKILRDLTA